MSTSNQTATAPVLSNGQRPVAGVSPPRPFVITDNENLKDTWELWKQQWQNYEIIANIGAYPEQYQCALFLHSIGTEAVKVCNSFSWANQDDKTKIAKIIDKFDLYTSTATHETYERYKFNNRNQNPSENFEAYLSAIRILAKSCNFCECLCESLIRDRIVLGIRGDETRKKLLEYRDLDLNKCIDLCRSAESTHMQIKGLAISGSNSETTVNRVIHQKKPQYKYPKQKAPSPKFNGNKPRNCRFCGKEHPFIKGTCPAYGKKCHGCGIMGHFLTMCSKRSKKVSAVNAEPDAQDVYYINQVRTPENSETNDEIYAQMYIGSRKIRFQVDSGAKPNLLPIRYVERLKYIQPTNKVL
ncbi:uncharacterized protein LOC141898923 [Tubulanus polymorphus]|uniref:uncharacterized protein LOC141898923 n=1 Tax=Tubulanus polymorphus TaxID=672921 RepID=UPI003DA5C7CF